MENFFVLDAFLMLFTGILSLPPGEGEKSGEREEDKVKALDARADRPLPATS